MSTYILKNGQQTGPYDDALLAAQLSAGQISYDDMAWKEGMAEWKPLRTILPPVGAAGSMPPPPIPPAMPAMAAGGMPTSDATGGVIPYKNPQALISYYMGIFSLVPFFGFLLCIPALVLGVLGLKKKKKFPQVRGTAHAWVGLITGGISLLYHGFIIIAIIGAAMTHR